MQRLSRDVLEIHRMHHAVARQSDFRVRIYLPSGAQIGVPSLSYGAGYTFESTLAIKECLEMSPWTKVLEDGTFELLPHAPTSLIHSNNSVGLAADPLGLCGEALTAVMSKALPAYEDVATNEDLYDEVSTPTTPSPVVSVYDDRREKQRRLG